MSMQEEKKTIQYMFIMLAEAGKIEELKSLLKNRKGDCLPALDEALIKAAKNGRYDVVEFLVDYGVNVRADNSAALFQAIEARLDLNRIINLLEEKGAYFDGLGKSHCIDLNHSWVTN